MSGINAISMIGYMNKLSAAYGGQKLTEATRTKLLALGVDVSGVTTEAQGQMKLREVQISQMTGSGKTGKKTSESQVNEPLLKARKLAHDLDVQYAETDTVDDILYKVSAKIEEMFVQAGDDEAKKSKAQYWANKLEEVKSMQRSYISLESSMNLTATMNIAYFGLY